MLTSRSITRSRCTSPAETAAGSSRRRCLSVSRSARSSPGSRATDDFRSAASASRSRGCAVGAARGSGRERHLQRMARHRHGGSQSEVRIVPSRAGDVAKVMSVRRRSAAARLAAWGLGCEAPSSERWGFVCEATRERSADESAIATLVGAAYCIRSGLTLDIGRRQSLSEPHEVTWTAGVTSEW